LRRLGTATEEALVLRSLGTATEAAHHLRGGGTGTMTTESELVTSRNRERMRESGLLDGDEEVIAYVNGFTLPPITSPVKMIVRAIAGQYRPSSWRAVVLTDKQLYICSLRGGRPGKLKSVLVTYPRGSYMASIADSDRPTTSFDVEGLDLSCPSRGRMRRSAEVIIAAGKRGEGAAA
jgi:hypothetical protein